MRRILDALRTPRGKRTFNIVVTLLALGISALAARHFASTGWPLQNADPQLVAAAGSSSSSPIRFKALGWHRLFHPSERPRSISLAAANGAASVTGAALPGRFDDVVRIAVVRRYPSCPSGVGSLASLALHARPARRGGAHADQRGGRRDVDGSAAVRAGLAIVAAAGLGAAS